MRLDLFDCHCYLGRFKQFMSDRHFHTREALLAEMDHYGIAEALVCDTLSRELDPRAGNPRVLEVCAGEPRLHPSWALAPPVQSLPYPLEELPARMVEAGVRAVRLFPGHLHFTLEDWNLRSILELLESHRVPIFADPTPNLCSGTRDLTDWDAMVRLCRAHPGLPVIATETRWYWPDRTWYPALEAAANLHLELSPFWNYGGIEFVCREYGAHRLLFGTRLPIRDPGGTVANLQYAEVSEDDRRAIAGGNLRRLLAGALSGVQRPQAEPAREVIRLPAPDPKHGALYLAIREAQEPLAGETLIDMHSHIGYGAPYFLPDSEPAQIVRQLRRYGFSKLVTFAFAGLNADWTWGNDFAYQAMLDYPDLILPLAAVNLWDEAQMEGAMARCCDELGFWGVKLHPWWNEYPETGPNIRRACAFCHERGLIVTNHYWGPASLLESYARDFPNAVFITGHLTGDEDYAAVVNRLPNVYVGTCLPIQRLELEIALKRLSPEKVLFGSDVPDLPLPLGFGPILYARIPDDTKRLIMGLNARRILEQVGANVKPPGQSARTDRAQSA